MSAEGETEAVSELASIVRTLIREGGDAFIALLRAAEANVMVGFVIGYIVTAVANTRLHLISDLDAEFIKVGLGALAGAEVVSSVVSIKLGGGQPLQLVPNTIVRTEASKIPESAISFKETMKQARRLPETISFEDLMAQLRNLQPTEAQARDLAAAAEGQITAAEIRAKAARNQQIIGGGL